MVKIRIKNEDKNFFRLVADAAFTNPFSTERIEIDRLITGIEIASDWKKRVPFMVDLIQKKLSGLALDTHCRFQDFQPEDQPAMRYTFLFEVYHQYAEKFDEFIVRQQRQGDSPMTISFGPQAINDLVSRGFTEKEAVQYFSMFYQIRRAFYFIDHGLVGQSDCMRQLRMALWNNIFTYDIRDYEQYMWDQMEDFSTLLEGPTGSGKGAAAAAIGRSGHIPYDPEKKSFITSFTTTFIPINLSQFAESLLESELFGHTKGAFTGAVSAHNGVLSLCEKHGSIFLDEIGEISIPAQVKLLKVLEERIFSPVGSHEKKRFYGRVIAATNRPINQLRKEGRFRDDFYYRLCSDCIQVPPLAQRVRENPNELNELVEHFTRLIIGQGNPDLTGRVIETIEKQLGKNYPWPGNVRELAQCIRRVVLKRSYEGQTAPKYTLQDHLKTGIETCSLTANELLDNYCKMLYDCRGTFEEVARLTGLDRRTVKKRIQECKSVEPKDGL